MINWDWKGRNHWGCWTRRGDSGKGKTQKTYTSPRPTLLNRRGGVLHGRCPCCQSAGGGGSSGRCSDANAHFGGEVKRDVDGLAHLLGETQRHLPSASAALPIWFIASMGNEEGRGIVGKADDGFADQGMGT